ncbi:MAG: O-antigen ligase family protein [Clostridia bacterium]|nr:O-antigen ligase family protein [Clostridia bacterium]
MIAAFEKRPKWLTKFFYSDLYLAVLAALILASWISGIMLIGFFAIIIFATVLLVIMDDIKPLIPILFYVAFCISDTSDLSVYYPYLPCLIPLILAIVFHLIFYHPRRFSLGELGASQILISIALLIGGCTCISLARWTGALTYSLLLGVGVFFIYFAWTNYTRGTPYGETSTYFAKIFMWMGLILVGEMITYYIRNRIGTPIEEWSSHEWIDLGWGIDNNVATLLLLSAPMCFYLATKKEHPTPYILVGVIHYLGIVSAYSRGGLLFAVVTAPIVLVATILKSKNKSESLIIIICLIIVALTALAFVFDKIKAIISGIFEDGLKSSSRILLYKDALHQFAAHPIFGVGTGYDGPDYENHVEEIVFYWFHSTFFQVVGSMGIVGIIAYGWNYLKRAKVIFKNIFKDTFILFSFLSLLGFELYSMIDTGTFVPLPTMMIVFIMFATIEKHHKEQLLLDDRLMNEEYVLEPLVPNQEPESVPVQAEEAQPENVKSQAEAKNV